LLDNNYKQLKIKNMKAIKNVDLKKVDEIRAICKNNRFIDARKNILEDCGYTVNYGRMGSGGVGHIRYMKDEIRIQITCGYTRSNYAHYINL